MGPRASLCTCAMSNCHAKGATKSNYHAAHLTEKPLMAGLESSQVLQRRRCHLCLLTDSRGCGV